MDVLDINGSQVEGEPFIRSRELGGNQKAGVYTSPPGTLASLRLYLTMCVHAPGLRIVGGMRGASGSFSYSSELSRGNILHQKPYTITEFLQEVKPEGAS